jgi:hypothetical protein
LLQYGEALMRVHKRHLIQGAILLLCLMNVVIGWMGCNPWPAIAGWVGFCGLGLQMARQQRQEAEAAQ